MSSEEKDDQKRTKDRNKNRHKRGRGGRGGARNSTQADGVVAFVGIGGKKTKRPREHTEHDDEIVDRRGKKKPVEIKVKTEPGIEIIEPVVPVEVDHDDSDDEEMYIPAQPQQEEVDANAPILLPFPDISVEFQEHSTYPKGSAAHALFSTGDGPSKKREFMLFQLPSTMPFAPPEKTTENEEEDEDEPPKLPELLTKGTCDELERAALLYRSLAVPTLTPQPGTSAPLEPSEAISSIHDGTMGKAKIWKSGRITMHLGEVVFEVSCGSEMSIHQQLIDTELPDGGGEGVGAILGHIKGPRFVCAPNVTDLLNKLK